LNGLSAAAYLATERTVPHHFLRHADELARLINKFVLWQGRIAFSNGNDWSAYHPLNYGWEFASRMFGDSISRALLIRAVLLFDRMQRLAGNGTVFGAFRPVEPYGRNFWSETISAGFILDGLYFCPDATPAASWEEVQQQALGLHNLPYSETVARRTPQTFHSFTWRSLWHEPLGVVVSKGGDSLGNWLRGSMIGSIELTGKEQRQTILCHQEKITEDEFATYGIVRHQCDNAEVEQAILFASLPDDRTALLYDRVTAKTNATVISQRGLTYTLENDLLNENKRLFSYKDKKDYVVGIGASQHIEIPDGYLNLDNTLTTISSKSLCYESPGIRNDRWKSIHFGILFIPLSGGTFSAGEIIREYIVLFISDHRPGEPIPSASFEQDGDVIRVSVTLISGKKVHYFINSFPTSKCTSEGVEVGGYGLQIVRK
jgi:hypothetical protein